jgi:4-hydroxy-4-methyl-2-oxoglutarate aldolase
VSVAIRRIPRAPAEVLEPLARQSVATIHEAQGRNGYLGPRLRPIFGGAHIGGSAVTVSLPPGDNWMIHVALELCEPGDVLVVAPTSSCEDGYFGELLGTAFATRGVRGAVIDAGCRDVADLEQLGFPVWSRAISATGTVKETLGDVNVPIVCGQQIIQPGDVIVADDDGVVRVQRARAAEVLASAVERENREAVTRRYYQDGGLGLDRGGMRERLAAKGLRYLETPEEHVAGNSDEGAT